MYVGACPAVVVRGAWCVVRGAWCGVVRRGAVCVTLVGGKGGAENQKWSNSFSFLMVLEHGKKPI